MNWKIGAALLGLSLCILSASYAAGLHIDHKFTFYANQGAGLQGRKNPPVVLPIPQQPRLVEGLDWTPPRDTREVWRSDSLERIQIACNGSRLSSSDSEIWT